MILIGISIGFVVGVIFGMICAEQHWKDKAVSKGKAEFYLTTFHEKKWRWK